MNDQQKNNSILRKLHMEYWQIISWIMVLYDILAINASYFLALLLRFDFRYSLIPEMYLKPYIRFAPIYTIFCIFIFAGCRLYKSVWRFASYDELIHVIEASVITTVFHIIGITVLYQRMPLSYYIMGAVFQGMLILAVRFSYRFILLLRKSTKMSEKGTGAVGNIMIIGAGNAGQALIRDIHRSQEVKGNVVCIIDHNPNKIGRYIDGVEIVGLDCIIGAYQGVA